MRIKIAFLLGVLLSFNSYSQKFYKNIKAPKIEISEWINHEKKDSTYFKNKTIIIEFWATWCGGCNKAIPHINELSEEFSNDSVIFLTLTSYDKKENVLKFLENHKINTYVVIDNNKKTNDNFKVKLLPQTALIDRHGYLRWKGTPGQLTKDFLQTFLIHDSIIKNEIKNPLIFNFSISHAKDRTESIVSYYTGNPFGFEFSNKGIDDVISQLFEFLQIQENEYRYMTDVPLEPRIDCEFRAAENFSEAFIYTNVIQYLTNLFDINIDTTIESQNIIELEVINDSKLNKYKVSDTIKYKVEGTDTTVEFYGIYLKRLCRNLSYEFEKPVYQISEKSGHFNFSYFKNDFEKTKAFFRREYGLLLKEKVKNVRVLEIYFN